MTARHERNAELVRAWRIAGDARALRDLVEENLPLVHRIARRWQRPPGIDPDELVAVGALALLRCCSTWDPERGTISTYATGPIRREIGVFLLRARSVVHVRQGRPTADASLDEPIGDAADGAFGVDLLADDRPVPEVLVGIVERARGVPLAAPSRPSPPPARPAPPSAPPASHVRPLAACRICWHPLRADIESAAEESIARTATRFRVDATSLERHLATHERVSA